MKGKIIFSVLMGLMNASCQKVSPSLEAGGVSSQSLCAQSSSASTQVQGLETLQAGQRADLSVGLSAGCGAAVDPVWKLGAFTVGQGTAVTTQIHGSGYYSLSIRELGSLAALSASAKASQAVQALAAPLFESQVVVAQTQALMVGPQVGYEDQVQNFSLSLPAGKKLASVIWIFSDGSPEVSSVGPVAHSFFQGSYEISARLRYVDGSAELVSSRLQIIPLPERGICALDQLAINGPVNLPVQRPVTFSLYLNSCLAATVTQASWNFGDGTAPVSGLTLAHSYLNPGSYTVSVQFVLYGRSVTLYRDLVVDANLEVMPGPVEVVSDLNKCPALGETRASLGAVFSETMSCGSNGKKQNNYQMKTVETCELVGEFRNWVQTSTDQVLVSEGACEAQSCELLTTEGKQILADGQSQVLYSSALPEALCSTVQVTRICRNGVLSGSSAARSLTCQDGCAGFGAHGAIQKDVITGEVVEPVACAYGETGVVNTFHQISNQTCQAGQIIVSDTRKGDLKAGGLCPVYQWVGTDNWSQCTQSCGGEQTRSFVCQNSSGEIFPAERCGGVAPTERRVCDGQPEAVKRLEEEEREEEAPSCARCPADQLGVVTQKRTVKESRSYACLNHQVQLVDTDRKEGAWVKESYCRDLVPHRCSHDSLSSSMAKGRYQWMVRCQDKIPMIKEFLEKMDESKHLNSTLQSRFAPLYPTFLRSDDGKPWKAPTEESAACEVPGSAYVAAVCVSSCSTPEQQILVEKDKRGFEYKPFIEALTQKTERVATLHRQSSMSSQQLKSTQVRSWVTELLDEDHQILVFRMKSGRQLKVTTNHPLLTAEGSMRLAAEFKAGESLVMVGGALDPILSIESTIYHGKVYNLFVNTNDLKQNVVVLNGYLNGTAFFQNEGAQKLNRTLFRQHLLRGVFPSEGGN